METSSSLKRPGKLIVRFLKYSLWVIFLLLMTFMIWQWASLMSGSNEWELIQDENGVKVYSIKAPGSNLKRFKSVTRVKATLGSFVKMMKDPNACGNFCSDGKLIEEINPLLQYSSYRSNMPSPFKPREIVVMIRFSQNSQTKELLTEVIATPNKVPRDPCCVRSTHKYNTWRLTPLPGGEVEMEFTFDEDFGGAVPAFLINLIMSKYMYEVLSHMQEILDQEKYKNAKLEFIEEIAADS